MTGARDGVTRRAFVGGAGEAAAIAALTTRDAAARPAAPPKSVPVGRLFAADFGIVGRGEADETGRVQAFLDHCMAEGAGIADFGSMRVRVSGPLFVRSLGVVFDAVQTVRGSAGFQVTGSGYTVLTVIGDVADFAVAVFGDGGVAFDAAGAITADTRPAVDGIQFGAADGSAELALSFIRYARVFGLAGFGIRHTKCWDSTFVHESMEQCGTAAQAAFEVVGSQPVNCCECVWQRVQVESAANRAIAISPFTLSSVFVKVHSERATARGGLPTWQFAGACEFGSVRLQAHNGATATAHFIGEQGQCRNLRAEGPQVIVDATGGVFSFYDPAAAIMRSSPNQNGKIVMVGGKVGQLFAEGYWLLVGCRVAELRLGFMAAGVTSSALDCDIGELAPQPGQTMGRITLQNCVLTAARLTSGADRIAHVDLLNATRLAGGLRIGLQTVTVDGTSTIVGDVAVAGGSLRLHGVVDGDLAIVGACHSTAGQDAHVTGKVTNWGAPQPGPLAPVFAEGMVSKNLAPVVTRSASGLAVTTGWLRAGGDWLPRQDSLPASAEHRG